MGPSLDLSPVPESVNAPLFLEFLLSSVIDLNMGTIEIYY